MQIHSRQAPAVGIRFAGCSVTGTAVRLRANDAFVETKARFPYGTRVTVVLPSDEPVEGIVRWSSATGVGIQFDRPRPRTLRALHNLIRTR